MVATVYTGAALWYNPAGLARIKKPSLELTGVTINMQVIKNPGLLTIDTTPQSESEGSGFNVSVVPAALTFSLKLKNPKLKLGIGLFNSSIRREFMTEKAIAPARITARGRGGRGLCRPKLSARLLSHQLRSGD